MSGQPREHLPWAIVRSEMNYRLPLSLLSGGGVETEDLMR